jgi:putative hydrolase of the HAD superfamily
LVKPEEVIYIDDRPMFVSIAKGLGINGICHDDINTTKEELSKFGFIV